MWGPILAFIMSLIGPLVSYVIKAIGFGIVTYVGLTFVFDQAENLINQRMSGIPAEMLAFANLMGFSSAVKIILSTASSCVAYRALIGSTGHVWKKPGSPPVKEM